MDAEGAKRILMDLYNGIDPETGDALPADHVCNSFRVASALHIAIRAIEGIKLGVPEIEKYPRKRKRIIPSRNASRRLGRRIRTPLTREQDNEIFDRFPEGSSCYIPFMLGYRAGTRLGETFAFFWNDIDFENNQIDINKQVQWYPERQQWRIIPPKYDSFRKIDLDREMMSCLKRERIKQCEARISCGKAYVRQYMDADGYINTTGKGKEIHLLSVREDGTYIQPRIMQHYSRIIHYELGNMAFDFHTLRHTHATELEEVGVDIKEIQRRLGHKSEKTTRRVYVHPTEAMRLASVKIINEMYMGRDERK